MEVIDIKEYRKKINKLKKLNKEADPLLEKLIKEDNNKKLILKNKYVD